jgi:hypothetical protein
VNLPHAELAVVDIAKLRDYCLNADHLRGRHKARVFAAVRTENVVGRSDSAAKAFVDAGGVSPTSAGSLIAFHRGGKWEYERHFFLPGADAPCARHGARLCHAPLPAYATRM